MDPITLAAIASIGSSVIGGLFGNSAADAQAKAQQEAAKVQRQNFVDSQALLKPAIDTGNAARGTAAGLLGLDGGAGRDAAMNAFTTSPGYKFRLGEGVNAIDQSAAASGTLNSGATGKALAKFGQDYGSNEFGSYFERLMGLAGGGASATGALVGAGTQNANNLSNLAVQGGENRAGAYAFQGANAQRGVNNVADLYSYYQPKFSLPGAQATAPTSNYANLGGLY